MTLLETMLSVERVLFVLFIVSVLVDSASSIESPTSVDSVELLRLWHTTDTDAFVGIVPAPSLAGSACSQDKIRPDQKAKDKDQAKTKQRSKQDETKNKQQETTQRRDEPG
jgi:hypothetical protein